MRKHVIFLSILLLISGCKYYFSSDYSNREISEKYFGRYRYLEDTGSTYEFYRDDESRLRITEYDADGEISFSYIVEFPEFTSLILLYEYYPDISFNSYVYFLDLDELTIAELDWEVIAEIYPEAETYTEELDEFITYDVLKIKEHPREFQAKVIEETGAVLEVKELVKIE